MQPCPETIVCVVQEAAVPESWRAVEQPALRIVELSDNLGFADAANLGVETAMESGAEWILLLNDDAVVEPSCLASCVQEARSDPSIAAVGPAVVFEDRPDTIWFAGGRHSDDFLYTRHNALGRPVDELPPTSDTDYIAGCCMLVRATAWHELGGFRKDFFLYYEDAEWCLRARGAGWRCRYLAGGAVPHRVSSSTQGGHRALSPTSAYYRARNQLRFGARHTAGQATHSYCRRVVHLDAVSRVGSSLVPTTGRRRAPTSKAYATGSAAGWARARGHAPSLHDERMRILVRRHRALGHDVGGGALASADDATYVHEPDNADANPLAAAAKHDLGLYPVLEAGERADGYARLWDHAFAGGWPTSPAVARIGALVNRMPPAIRRFVAGSAARVLGEHANRSSSS